MKKRKTTNLKTKRDPLYYEIRALLREAPNGLTAQEIQELLFLADLKKAILSGKETE